MLRLYEYAWRGGMHAYIDILGKIWFAFDFQQHYDVDFSVCSKTGG